jgi:micrococcal nuclease
MVLKVSTTQDNGDMQVLEKDVLRLTKENQRLKGDIKVLEKDISRLTQENSKSYTGYEYDYTEPQYNEVEINPKDYCYGNADCFVGTVSKIVDGDTIEVDGQSIRFALVNAPELHEYGGIDAREYIQSVCPVGSTVLVDEDDGQTQGSYGRTIAIVYCNDLNYILNAAVIESGHAVIDTPYCSNSEFSYDYWALYGCVYDKPSQTQQPKKEPSQTPQPSCDPSYPGVCIAPYPPDLNCGDIPYKNFKVVGSDPHGFDGDNDGIGCES